MLAASHTCPSTHLSESIADSQNSWQGQQGLAIREESSVLPVIRKREGEARETEDGLRWIWMCLRFCFWCRHLVHMATGFILSLCVCVFLILSHVQIRTHTHTQTRTNAAKWKSHLSPAWKNLILTNPSKSPVKQFATFCQTFFSYYFFFPFILMMRLLLKSGKNNHLLVAIRVPLPLRTSSSWLECTVKILLFNSEFLTLKAATFE